eukprot:5797810-Prorocentrum_lima.AAC.1
MSMFAGGTLAMRGWRKGSGAHVRFSACPSHTHSSHTSHTHSSHKSWASCKVEASWFCVLVVSMATAGFGSSSSVVRAET